MTSGGRRGSAGLPTGSPGEMMMRWILRGGPTPLTSWDIVSFAGTGFQPEDGGDHGLPAFARCLAAEVLGDLHVRFDVAELELVAVVLPQRLRADPESRAEGDPGRVGANQCSGPKPVRVGLRDPP